MAADGQITDRALGAFGAMCRRAGIKATHQRTEIYRELAGTNTHPDAEAIYRRVKARIPAISFDTVYRTLRTFEKKGLVTRVGPILDRSRFDANLARHHHFVCTDCGLVRDFTNPAFDRLTVPPDVEGIGTPASVTVEVRGLCHRCGKTAATPSRQHRTHE